MKKKRGARQSGALSFELDLDESDPTSTASPLKLKRHLTKPKPPPPAPPPIATTAYPPPPASHGTYDKAFLDKLRNQQVAPPPLSSEQLDDASALSADAADANTARALDAEALDAALDAVGVHVAGATSADAYVPLGSVDSSEDQPLCDGREALPTADGSRRSGRGGYSSIVVELDDSFVGTGSARGGGSAPARAALKSGSVAAAALRLNGAGVVDEIAQRLADEVGLLRDALATQESDARRSDAASAESRRACATLADGFEREKDRFELFQGLKAYADSLLDCLGTKLPLIEPLERRLVAALEQCAQRRRAASEAVETAQRERAERLLSESGETSWSAPLVERQMDAPACYAEEGQRRLMLQRLELARSARRDRRANAAGSGVDASGSDAVEWTSDEEADLESAVRACGGDGWSEELGKEEMAVQREAAAIFDDADDEFHQPLLICRRFAEWEARDPESYEQAYVDACLPTILSVPVRLALLGWQPMERGSLEATAWHRAVSEALSNGPKARTLLTGLCCTHALPRLKHAVEHSWDVSSLSRGEQLAAAVRGLGNSADALRGNEPTAESARASMRDLLTCVATRLNDAVRGVCIPPCVRTQATGSEDVQGAAADTLRSLQRALKLLNVMGIWVGLLTDGILQELMGQLVSKHVLHSARQLASASHWEEAASAVLSAAGSLPVAWRARNEATGLLPACSLGLVFYAWGELLQSAPCAASATSLRQSLESLGLLSC